MFGFNPTSDEPLSGLMRRAVFFDAECFVFMRATPPVEFLTGDPTKRLVYAVEIAVLPLAGQPIPAFGDEIVLTGHISAAAFNVTLRSGVLVTERDGDQVTLRGG